MAGQKGCANLWDHLVGWDGNSSNSLIHYSQSHFHWLHIVCIISQTTSYPNKLFFSSVNLLIHLDGENKKNEDLLAFRIKPDVLEYKSGRCNEKYSGNLSFKVWPIRFDHKETLSR